ncbi:hypothetical protein NM688_g4795 [Phlebia brevispora]|uniref:Uncharacterized protein n=1 Tax=Phlebia brevispora TaxID=194682 RepID=A0ACC1T1X0_9APHY|nr:hypothetical protein NM688_g4795 [Phlebia brevispora]
MPKHDVPPDITFLVCLWMEALVYGFFTAIFAGSLYVNLTLRRNQDFHSRMMFYVSILMFIIATLHVSMNCFRMVEAYVIHRDDPGGPVAWISALAPWHHVFKDTLYATQEMLGDAAAIYRTYVVWGRNWKAVVLPGALLTMSLISGYAVCGLYPSEKSSQTVFDPRLTHWITTFYSISVVQSGMTTSLMAFRIWQTDRRSAAYRTNKEGNLMPIFRILVESASIQFVVEVILLSLYCANFTAQYLLLEMVTPLVGITFGAITIRIALHQSKSFSSSRGPVSHVSEGPVATIGSIPMRPMPISISITKDVEAHGDGNLKDSPATDYSDMYHKRQKGSNSSDEEIATVH